MKFRIFYLDLNPAGLWIAEKTSLLALLLEKHGFVIFWITYAKSGSDLVRDGSGIFRNVFDDYFSVSEAPAGAFILAKLQFD